MAHCLVNYQQHGIRGNYLNLIESYLTNRLQYSDTHAILSNIGHKNYGVPQGSLLCPLFNIHKKHCKHTPYITDIVLYADDTNTCFC